MHYEDLSLHRFPHHNTQFSLAFQIHSLTVRLLSISANTTGNIISSIFPLSLCLLIPIWNFLYCYHPGASIHIWPWNFFHLALSWISILGPFGGFPSFWWRTSSSGAVYHEGVKTAQVWFPSFTTYYLCDLENLLLYGSASLLVKQENGSIHLILLP